MMKVRQFNPENTMIGGPLLTANTPPGCVQLVSETTHAGYCNAPNNARTRCHHVGVMLVAKINRPKGDKQLRTGVVCSLCTAGVEVRAIAAKGVLSVRLLCPLVACSAASCHRHAAEIWSLLGLATGARVTTLIVC